VRTPAPALWLLAACCSAGTTSAGSSGGATTGAGASSAGVSGTAGTTGRAGGASATGGSGSGSAGGSSGGAGPSSSTGGSAGSRSTSSGGTTGAPPAHVALFAHYGDGYSPKDPPLDPADAGAWIDWSECGASVCAALRDAGVHTYWYTDFVQVGASDYVARNAYPCDFAHGCDPACTGCDPSTCSASSTCSAACAADEITSSGGAYHLMDARSPHLATLWDQEVAANPAVDAGAYDAVFADDMPLPYGVALACGADAGNWARAEAAVLASLPHPVVFNGAISFPYPSPAYYDAGALSPYAVADYAPPNVVGARGEECYGAGGATCDDAGLIDSRCQSPGSDPEPGLFVWQQTENTELWVARNHQVLICMEDNRGLPECSPRQRLYYIASFLLTYAPPWTVAAPLWGWQGSFPYLEIFPEETLVPTEPLVPAPEDVAALQRDGGTYAREWAACYLRGTPVGPCAIVVNSDCASHPFPTLSRTYAHTLALSGSGSLFDGAVATPDGGPPADPVPELTGLIALP